MNKGNYAKKALRKLLKSQRKKLQEQGYKDEEEFIKELVKIPIADLQKKKEELKKENEST